MSPCASAPGWATCTHDTTDQFGPTASVSCCCCHVTVSTWSHQSVLRSLFHSTFVKLELEKTHLQQFPREIKETNKIKVLFSCCCLLSYPSVDTRSESFNTHCKATLAVSHKAIALIHLRLAKPLASSQRGFLKWRRGGQVPGEESSGSRAVLSIRSRFWHFTWEDGWQLNRDKVQNR